MQVDRQENNRIECPVCRQTSHEHLYEVDAGYSAKHMFNFSGPDDQVSQLTHIIQSMWGGNTADMLRCSHCQLVFADPFLAGTQEFYSAVYQRDDYYPGWKWDYEITYGDLRLLAGDADMAIARLLEVGAGNGAFVKKLAEEMFAKENLLCTEYSEFGAGLINSLGIHCTSGPFQDLKTPEYKSNFDYICMFQVLEHMDQIQELFNTLNHLSKKGTNLYITVPAYEYRDFYDRLGRHFDTPPNHLTRWNYTSFNILAQQFGWSIIRHHIQPMSYAVKLKKLIFERLEFHKLFRSSKWTGKKINFIVKAWIAMAASGICLAYAGSMFRLRNKNLGISQWIKLTRD